LQSVADKDISIAANKNYLDLSIVVIKTNIDTTISINLCTSVLSSA